MGPFAANWLRSWNQIGQLEDNRYTGVYLLEAVRDSTVRRELGIYIHLGDGISLGVDWLHRNPFTPQEIADFKPNLARLFSNLAPASEKRSAGSSASSICMTLLR